MTSSVVLNKRKFSDDSTSTFSDSKKLKIISNNNKDKEISEHKKFTNLIDENTGLSRCFHRIRAKMYLSLAPCYLENPIEGLRQQHLDPLIMSYNSTVEGIIITYNNVRLSKENLNNNNNTNEFKYVAKISDENPFSFVWALVDFVVWRPCIGDKLEGYTIMQSQSHIGLLINDVFNASIKKFYIPEDWYFVPSQADESNSVDNSTSISNFKSLGHWCDSNGVPIGGKIQFTVRAIHVNGKGLSIEGTLLTPDMERDSKPVMFDNIKENIKKHVKFDGEITTTVTTDTNNEDDENEEEMKEKLPVIEPLKEDVVSPEIIGEDDNDSGNSDDSKNKDDAPKYNDDSSDSESDSKGSDDSDSDSDSKQDSDSD